MNEKLLCEKYGSDFSVIKPGDVSGLSLPCPIFVANKNGWQVEEYKDEDGNIKHSQVIRFFNKGNDDILCMKIEYNPQILNKTAKCDYTEDELLQIKTFIGKCYEILILHNLGVIDSTQLIAAINVKLNPEKQLAKYRIKIYKLY